MDIGIISKKDDNSLSITKKLIDLLNGHNLYFDIELAQKLLHAKSLEEADRIDIIIWIGGDGTLLRYVNKIIRFKAKLLGIKTGGVGFLCEISPEGLKDNLKLIFEGKYTLEGRSLLEVKNTNETYYALNDAVLYSSELGRVSSFVVKKDEEEIFSGKCDGILISTSLGSTAYIASRGGPIVDPSLDVLIFDPLNPLKWGSRVLILPFNSKLEVVSSKNCKLVIDGNIITNVEVGSKIHISGSEQKFQFIRLKKNFYEKVKSRMLKDV
ncbi:MAG TPA: NAD(+)/NADH kinase [Geobacterales bacterium]|nr:NAD(+)/NADH kinase [Geobacterales bacterium]